MGEMLRSDLMTLCDIYLQPETAFDVLAELGEFGCVQFKDMTPDVNAFQRPFVADMRRCIELDRRLRYMKGEMFKDGIYIPEMTVLPPPLQPSEVNLQENRFEKLENDIREMEDNHVRLMKNNAQLKEMNYVLTHMGPVLGDLELRRESLIRTTKDGSGEPSFTGRLFVKTGVVLRSKSYPFETMLWRISLGNIYYRTATEDKVFVDPFTGAEMRKVAFLLIYQGETLDARLEKICSGFRVNIYPCPRTARERSEMISKLHTRLTDLEQVLMKTKYHRCKALRAVGREWRTWDVQVKKSKAIYHIMNHFNVDISRKLLIGQCWVPDHDLPRVKQILKECSVAVGSRVASFITKSSCKEVPPTYHRTNKFTNGFQALISAYGDSTYRELNPGLYTIITFPFLFAVMFGDIGHGMIMLSFAIWMVVKEKKFMSQISDNEIWNIFFGGRYIILLMGSFTLFTGFMYNDIFAKQFRLTKSYWVNTFSEKQIHGRELEFFDLDPALKTRNPYPFGLDPMWGLAKNKIMFDNSLKMKMSIILGVIHMMFGLWISFFNHIYFKRYYAIVLEFIPQVIFLTCLFAWLVFMIYFKWFKYSAKDPSLKLRPGCAPLILILFIDMALMRKTEVEDKNCDAYMFEGQQLIQMALMGVGLCSVPVLLFGSPVYVHFVIHKQKNKQKPKKPSKKDEEDEGHGEGFGELMIHQSVHTIEFVLSTISHTASYLRLWALSLAHAQLSDMLWNMILSKNALQKQELWHCVMVYVIFGAWAVFSLSILVLMEGLSAFLHTLRLHWVEFMSKFYTGTGHKFCPFNFSDIIHGDAKDEKPVAAPSKGT